MKLTIMNCRRQEIKMEREIQNQDDLLELIKMLLPMNHKLLIDEK